MNPEYGVAARRIKYDLRCINSHAVSNQQGEWSLRFGLTDAILASCFNNSDSNKQKMSKDV